MQNILGFFTPALLYLFIFILNYLLPGRWVTGYVTKEGSDQKLRYRLNGLIVLFTVISLWFLASYLGFIEWDYLYQIRWYGLAGAITFGLIFSLAIVLPYAAVKKNFFADFFFGRAENPQLWKRRIDAKMYLYRSHSFRT